jgi:kynureninase
VVSALGLNSERKEIISDVLNFPTDLYTIRGAIQLLNQGHTLILLESDDGIRISNRGRITASAERQYSLGYLLNAHL